jgi:hypothetical protein
LWFGADATSGGDALIVVAVWGFAGVVVTQIVVLLAPIVKARFDRSRATTSPPQAAPADGTLALAKDIGQLDQRADDNDARDDWQDRRLDALERYNEFRDPGWRQR